MTPGANIAFGRFPSLVTNFFSGTWLTVACTRPRAITTGARRIGAALVMATIHYDVRSVAHPSTPGAECIRPCGRTLSPPVHRSVAVHSVRNAANSFTRFPCVQPVHQTLPPGRTKRETPATGTLTDARRGGLIWGPA